MQNVPKIFKGHTNCLEKYFNQSTITVLLGNVIDTLKYVAKLHSSVFAYVIPLDLRV